MTDFDDNQIDDFDDFENFDVEIEEFTDQKSKKRGFIVILGGIFAIALIVLIGVAVFYFHLLPGQNQQRYSQALEINNRQTATAEKLTVEAAMQNVQTAQPSQTPLLTETIRFEAMTDEEVLQLSAEPKQMLSASPAADNAATATAEAAAAKALTTQDLTATIEAVMTQSADGGKSISTTSILSVEEAMTSTALSAATATALPHTGFADEVGLPFLLGAAALLLVIIFVSRRLRTA